MPDQPPSERSLALIALRHRRGWTQDQLGTAVGITGRMISLYESGDRDPSPRLLLKFAAAMGYSEEEVDCLLFGTTAVCDPESEELGPEESRLVRQEAARAGLARVKATASLLYSAAQRARWRIEREEAAPYAARLLRLAAERPATERSARRQEALVAEIPDHLAWAVVDQLNVESLKATAVDSHRAAALSDLACRVADHDRTGKGPSPKLQGRALAFRANALRVVGDHAGSEEAFAKARKLLKGGGSPGGGPGLPPWRFLDMQASLRRDQRRWKEAIDLADRVLVLAPEREHGRILLKKAFTLKEMGEPEHAIRTLREAAPSIQEAADPRLAWVLHFNLVVSLVEAGRPTEAEAHLPRVRDLAIDLGNEIDVLRCQWAAGRIAWALGRSEEALCDLEQVRRAFAAREMPYDCALAALEEASIRLENGEYPLVQALARDIVWIFGSRSVVPEALASLRLFCKAADALEATADLARQVHERVRSARSGTSPPTELPRLPA
jgi:transcriptional regulator with XRE-family HTH domain